MKDACFDAELIEGVGGLTGTLSAPYEWDMWQLQEVQFTPLTLSIDGCPVSYALTDIDIEKTAVEGFTFNMDLPSFSGVWREGPVERYFFLRESVYNMNGDHVVLESSAKYFVKIVNPCLRLNPIMAQTLDDL